MCYYGRVLLHAAGVGLHVDTTACVFLADVNLRSRSLYAIARPSVVCLSVCRLSVTLVHPTQLLAIFGNFFTVR